MPLSDIIARKPPTAENVWVYRLLSVLEIIPQDFQQDQLCTELKKSLIEFSTNHPSMTTNQKQKACVAILKIIVTLLKISKGNPYFEVLYKVGNEICDEAFMLDIEKTQKPN